MKETNFSEIFEIGSKFTEANIFFTKDSKWGFGSKFGFATNYNTKNDAIKAAKSLANAAINGSADEWLVVDGKHVGSATIFFTEHDGWCWNSEFGESVGHKSIKDAIKDAHLAAFCGVKNPEGTDELETKLKSEFETIYKNK